MVEAHATSFERDGFVIVPHFALPETVECLIDFIDLQLEHNAQINQRREALAGFDPLTIVGSGAEARYKQMVLGDVMRRISRIHTLYSGIYITARRVLDRDLVPAPFDAWPSCINANLYTKPGDRQGWHIDTNPVSALLYLISPFDAPLVIGDERRPIPEETAFIVPGPGDLVLLDGTRPHRVSPILTSRRVNISFNLYGPDGYKRPEHTDGLLYA